MNMNWFGLVLAIIVLVFTMYYGIKFSFKQGSTWVVLAEGQFSFAKFSRKLSSLRGGAAMYTSAQNLAKTAEIHFFDGSWCHAFGVDSIPASRGDRIRVLQNGFGECKVERVE